MAELIASFRDGLRVGDHTPADRALRFADGIFETIPLWRGEPLYRREHSARWRRGLRALRMPNVNLNDAIAPALALAPARALLRVSAYALGGSGYQRPERLEPMVWLDLNAGAPDPWRAQPALRLRWCALRLAVQPALAGIKHLNRLEQILARAEWRDPAIHEGLLCDQDGQVIEGTVSNLFIVRDGRVQTPLLDRCGVAGVLRARILKKLAPEASEARLTRADVLAADELFVCNSVRGIRPVAQLGTRRFALGAVTRELIERLRCEAGAAFYQEDIR